MIHIMIGLQYWDDDASYNLVTGLLEEDLRRILRRRSRRYSRNQRYRTATTTGFFAVQQANLEVNAVATKYGVPIINYSGAFSNARLVMVETLLEPAEPRNYSAESRIFSDQLPDHYLFTHLMFPHPPDTRS